MDIAQELQEISHLLDLCEINKNSDSIKQWLNQLSDKSLGFIRHLITEIRFDPPSFDLISILYKIQVKCQKKVSKQIIKDSDFIKKLTKFLSNLEMTEQFLDFFNVLILCGSLGKGVKINKSLYSNIADSINWIISDEVLDAALDIIGDKLIEYKKEFLRHKNATLIVQLLLSKLNRSEGFSKLKNFENFAMIIKENMNLCYTTDMMVLCDILLSVFDNRNKVAYRSAAMVLESLYFNEEFSALRYKVEEILETLEEIKSENFYINPELIKRLNMLKAD